MTEHRVTPVVESRPVVGGAAAGRGLEVVTGAADPPSFARTLPRDAQQVRAARLMVSQALDTWGLTALGDSARLVATELMSNAVLHARRRYVCVTVTRRPPGGCKLRWSTTRRNCRAPSSTVDTPSPGGAWRSWMR